MVYWREVRTAGTVFCFELKVFVVRLWSFFFEDVHVSLRLLLSCSQAFVVVPAFVWLWQRETA